MMPSWGSILGSEISHMQSMQQHPELMGWGMGVGVGEREKQPQMSFSSTPPQGTANLVAQTLQEPAEKRSSYISPPS